MVASPTDVQPERDILHNVVNEINSDTAHQAGFHLELIRWEADTYPGFHAMGPQGLIDEVLDIKNADLLIGIFWHRLGTPTSDGRTGAEHEFQEAYANWQAARRPQIMVYFNEQEVPQKALDPHQFARLREFKKLFPKEGLSWSYHGENAFAKLVNGHLRRFLIRRMSPMPVALENVVAAISQRGLPLSHDDFRGIQETPNLSSDVTKQRQRIWIDMQQAEERVEQLFQSSEFCEVRAKLGNALAGQFIRLLVHNQSEDAEKYLRSCGLALREVMHLMRVADEAMTHATKTSVQGGVPQDPR